jgi:DNA adenine methylase
MDRKWWSIIGLCGVVALLCSGEDKKASAMSGIRKRRSRRIYYIYDGRTINREQVNEAKRLARAGYGTLYATWAYTTNEAKDMIREGKAERVSGLGDLAYTPVNESWLNLPSLKLKKQYNGKYKAFFIGTNNPYEIGDYFLDNDEFESPSQARAVLKAYVLKSLQKQEKQTFTGRSRMTLFGGLGYKGYDEEGAINATVKNIDKFQGKPAYIAATYTGIKATSIKPPYGQQYYRVNPDSSVDYIKYSKGATTEERIRNPKLIALHGLNLPQIDSLPPILGWVGGKTKLADKIISMMPPHKVYVEPFLGGGSVFFKKPLADVNVINDLDKDLMNFYKGVRDGSCEKIRECKLPKNRTEFDRAVDNKAKDICSYLGVNKISYASNMNIMNYSQNNVKKGNQALRFKELCGDHKNKLKKAKMLNKDYKDVIKQYDSKDTLCYIDPHYVDNNYYGHSDVNPEDVAKLVKSMKGKAIVSYNNHPRIRRAFQGLNIHRVKTKYGYQANMTGAQKDVSELIITNF